MFKDERRDLISAAEELEALAAETTGGEWLIGGLLAQFRADTYRLIIREPNWHEHRSLKGPDTNVNLHGFSPGSPELTRHLVFRDWLRAHPEDRDLYERTKRSLAAKAELDDVRAYTDAKDAVIDAIYARAAAHRPLSPR